MLQLSTMQENQTQINPTNFNDNLASENIQSNKSNNLLKGFALFVLLLAVATLFTGIGLYIGQQQTGKQMTNKTENQSDTTLTQKSDENQPNSENEKKSNQDLMFTYISNNALYLYKNGEKTKVSREGEFLVKAFSYNYEISNDQKHIVYTFDNTINEVNGTINTSPKKVALYNTATSKHEIIFDLTDKNNPEGNPEFVTEITNVKFSNKSDTIAIGSSHGIFLYYINNKETKEIVTNDTILKVDPKDPSGKGITFNYAVHSFSPDDTKLAYAENLYEHGYANIVNIETRVTKRISEKFMGYGQSMVGFLNNNEFIYLEDFTNLNSRSLDGDYMKRLGILGSQYPSFYNTEEKIYFVYEYNPETANHVEPNPFSPWKGRTQVFDKKTMTLENTEDILGHELFALSSIQSVNLVNDEIKLVLEVVKTIEDADGRRAPQFGIAIYDMNESKYNDVFDL